MSSRRLRVAVCFVVAAGLLALIGYSLHPKSDVPVFDVRFFSDPYGTCMRVRGNAQNGSLLVTEQPPDWAEAYRGGFAQPVYSYHPEVGKLEEVSAELWSREGGLIVGFDTTPVESQGCTAGARDGTLWVRCAGQKTRAVQTIGRVALTESFSPDESLLAVLTTNGVRLPQARGWFFSGGGGYWGQHFVEVFDLGRGVVPKRTAIRIPFTNAGGLGRGSMVWSPDSNYLVVVNGEHKELCVIHATTTGGID